jgi:hypothetical protein
VARPEYSKGVVERGERLHAHPAKKNRRWIWYFVVVYEDTEADHYWAQV